MKKLITSVAATFILCTLIFAQSPKGIKYQAVVRDAAGSVLVNKPVSLRISVISGDDTGPTEFIEVHECITNDFGLVVCTLGKGTPVYGFFNDVVWESQKHFMGVEIDPDGGSNYTLVGVSEMMSVPYAMHAETVTDNDDADADPSNEIQDLKMVGNSIRITGNVNPTSIDLTPYINTDNQQISFDNVTNMLTIQGGNDVDLSDLKDSDEDPTNEIQNIYRYGNNITLSRGGGTVNIDDSDSDSTNELQTISQVGNVVTLSQGGGSINVSDGDDSPTNEIQDLMFNNNYLIITDNPNATIVDLNPLMDNTDQQQLSFDDVTYKLALDNGGLVDLTVLKDDADADATNEIQTVTQVGNDITLSHGGGTFTVADNDNDATNELQTLSQNGNIVTLSHGGGTISIADGDSNPMNEIQDLYMQNDSLIITGNMNATIIDLTHFIDDDGNPMNEIQDLFIQGDSLAITNNAFATIIDLAPYKDNTDNQNLNLNVTDLEISGGNTVDLSSFMDNTDAQDMTLSGNSLSLTGDVTPVDLSPYLDNTDAQDMTLSGNSLGLTGDVTPVDLSPYLDNTDAQDMTLSGNSLGLTGDVTPVDLSPYLDNTDAQDMTLSGNSLGLTGDVTPVDLSPYLDNTDAQDMTLSGNSLGLTGDVTPVDLSSYLDNTDAQDMTLSGNSLGLTGDVTPVDLSPYLDNTDAQDMTLSGNSLGLTGDVTPVDLSPYLDNTDAQDMTLSGNSLGLTGDVTPVDLSSYLDNTDAQNLSISGDSLSISGGNSVDLSTMMDNADNQNLTLSNDTLFIEGGNNVDLGDYRQDLTHQQLWSSRQVTIKISNGANTTISVFDGDSSETNELQTISEVLTKGNDVAGIILANVGQIQSTVTTGTAPFTIASTTKVTNLNVDLLDGLSSADFVQAANNLSDISNPTTARTNLGLVIGVDVQDYDDGLVSLANLNASADKMIYSTGADAFATTDITIFGRGLVGNVNAAAACTNLGLGTGDMPVFSGVTLTGDAEVGSSDAVYFGDKTTDGSWRFIRSVNDMYFERREAGVWVMKFQMNP